MNWEENVRKVVPYTAGEQPNDTSVIKLNTNECPYPPAPGVKKAIEEFDYDTLRLYPDMDILELREHLAGYYHIKTEQVFVGVGSDDVLAMAFLTFFNTKKPILFPDITYSFYDVWAELYKIPYKTLPLDENFKIRKEDYMQENGGIVIANPNAPTGVFMAVSEIEDIIRANQDVVVIVDEAYVDFGAESALPLLEKYDNLLIVQTFSKSRAMAGMRIGFAMANTKLIKYLQDVKFAYNSYTMNRTALAAGVAAVDDDAYFKETIGKIIATRERIKKEMAALGFVFTDTMSNFIFASHTSIPAEEIFNALKQNKIYVRHWKKPRIDNYLRITIGTDEEMDKMMSFLKKYITERA